MHNNYLYKLKYKLHNNKVISTLICIFGSIFKSMKEIYILILLLSIYKPTYSQEDGTNCGRAFAFCDDFGSRATVVNGDAAENGPNYGCLETRPNPIWNYLKIETAGNIDLRISQVDANGGGIDVDFICYGPFNDQTAPCATGQLTAAKTIACSYSSSAVETLTIPNALVGEFYLILITNFSEQSGILTFEQTNVGGELDCSITCKITVNQDQTICINSSYIINTVLGHPGMQTSAQYKWFKNNVEIIGETNAFLEVTSNTVNAIPDTYRVEVDADNCNAPAEDSINLSFVDVFSNFLLTNISPINVCDDDNNGFVSSINLTQNEIEIANLENATDYAFTYYTNAALTNQITDSTSFENTIIDMQTIYVSMTHRTFIGCNETTSFDVIINKIPEFEVSDNLYTCINLPLEIKTFNVVNPQGNYTYSWTDTNAIEVSNTDTLNTTISGDYTITATNTSFSGFTCTTTNTVSLYPTEPATITDVIINEYWRDDNFSIDIKVTGIGIYEYALNDIDGPYQEDSYFINISPGVHEIFVRETHGCGMVSRVIEIFGFSNYFSPNNDGINDIWKVQGITFNALAKIYIFDRYGKLMTKFFPYQNQGWNGLYKSTPAPEADYWFTAEMVDYKGKSITRRGHFSLIRTNN